MTIIDVRYQLNKILSYDRINDSACRKYESLLKILEDAGDSRYLLYKAKFYERTEKYNEAKECYLALTDSKTEQFFAYYGLYTLAVSKKNYEDAYKYILLCDKLGADFNMDLSFHIALTKACYDLTVNPDEFYNNKYKVVLDDEKHGGNYNMNKQLKEAAGFFNKHNFVSATASLKEARACDDSVNAYFETKILLDSIINLLELEKTSYLEFVKKNGITAKFINGKVDVRQLLNYMQLSIVSNFDLVFDVFSDNYDYILEMTSELAFDYIKKRLFEKRIFEGLNKEEMDDYVRCIVEVKRAMHLQDFKRVIEYATLGKELTGMPVFDYYVGKAYFRSGKNLDAIDKLREYMDKGGIKALKARGYLSAAYENIGDYQKSALLQEEITQLKRFYVKIGRSKIYTGPTFKASKEKNSEEKMLVSGISENVDNLIDDNLVVSDFYSYSFPQKMALIRKLYLTNMVKVADKLMKEVERESDNSVEKEFINKERQNKKLYITKGKLGQH